MALTEPIRDLKQVQALLSYYKNRGETRNHLLIIALHTALRISDAYVKHRTKKFSRSFS